MKITPCELPERQGAINDDLVSTIEEFIALGVPCVEIEWRENYENSHSATGACRATLKRLYKGDIHVAQRRDKLFLVRERGEKCVK